MLTSDTIIIQLAEKLGTNVDLVIETLTHQVWMFFYFNCVTLVMLSVVFYFCAKVRCAATPAQSNEHEKNTNIIEVDDTNSSTVLFSIFSAVFAVVILLVVYRQFQILLNLESVILEKAAELLKIS